MMFTIWNMIYITSKKRIMNKNKNEDKEILNKISQGYDFFENNKGLKYIYVYILNSINSGDYKFGSSELFILQSIQCEIKKIVFNKFKKENND